MEPSQPGKETYINTFGPSYCGTLYFAERVIPFHLHNELLYQIKASLNSKSRTDVDVRIELPFDQFLFTGGLQQAGRWIQKSRSHDVYTIRKYSALTPLLGHQWHLRVLNKQMDFCYVILETVQYYLRRRQGIEDAMDSNRSVHGGHILVFHFVRGDGVRRNWDDIVKIE